VLEAMQEALAVLGQQINAPHTHPAPAAAE
jgi:hypothetical protein